MLFLVKKMFNAGSTGRQMLSLGQICKQKGLDQRKFKLSGEKTQVTAFYTVMDRLSNGDIQRGNAFTKPALPTISDVP